MKIWGLCDTLVLCIFKTVNYYFKMTELKSSRKLVLGELFLIFIKPMKVKNRTGKASGKFKMLKTTPITTLYLKLV